MWNLGLGAGGLRGFPRILFKFYLNALGLGSYIRDRFAQDGDRPDAGIDAILHQNSKKRADN